MNTPLIRKNTFWKNNKNQRIYKVLDLVIHSETNDLLVLYKRNNVKNPELYVRPVDLFVEKFEEYLEDE